MRCYLKLGQLEPRRLHAKGIWVIPQLGAAERCERIAGGKREARHPGNWQCVPRTLEGCENVQCVSRTPPGRDPFLPANRVLRVAEERSAYPRLF